jgi:hypothetical protein
MKANLAQHQLDTAKGSLFGYELARKMTAQVLRRMLGTSNRTNPTLLILESGWELPDLAIIREKLKFHSRMAQRTYNEKRKQLERKEKWKRKDSATHVWKARLVQVEQGETVGICAEAKRLWQEAKKSTQWPPRIRKRATQRDRKMIEIAAKTITEKRLHHELQQRSEIDGDTPYAELHDGTIWRITNGDKREVGLMTTARLGALMTNAGRSADGAQIDPLCTCCRKEHDTARHVLLQCPSMEAPRNRMWELLMEIWDDDQQEEFAAMTEQQQYMTLLGKKMSYRASLNQEVQLDSAIKTTLVRMDDIRQNTYGQQPMNGRIHNRPPEQSIMMAEQWRELDEQRSLLGDQELLSDNEDDYSDDYEEEPQQEDHQQEEDPTATEEESSDNEA